MQNDNSSAQKTTKDFIVLGLGIFLNLLIGVLTTPIITRMVSPANYGKYSLFVMYSEIIMVVLGLGLDQTLVRYFYHKEDLNYRRKLLSKCTKLPFVLCLFMGLLILLFIYILPNFLNVDFFLFLSEKLNLGISSKSIIPFLFVILTFFLLVNRYAMLLVRLQYKSFTYSLLNVFQKLFYVIFACAFIILLGSKEKDFIYLALATIISYFLVSLIAIIVEKKFWNHINLKNTSLPYDEKELYKYGIPLIFSSSIARLLQACGSTMLKLFCDEASVGIYASAINLVHIFAIIQTTFNILWAPLMIEHYQKNKDDKEFYIKANQLITVLLFFFGATMLVFKDLFAVLLGNDYQQAIFVLPFLIFYPIMYTISETTCCGIVFMKKTHMNIVVSLLSLISNIILCILLIPKLNLLGAAISTGVSYIVFYFVRTLISKKYYPIKFNIGKLIFVILLFGLFCLYSCFNSFNLLMFCIYFVFILILGFLYKDSIAFILKFMINYMKNLKSKFKRKNG